MRIAPLISVIALMFTQTPAWPAEWDVDFKLHAPYQTTVEGKVRSGRMTSLNVAPKQRQDDVILMNAGDGGTAPAATPGAPSGK